MDSPLNQLGPEVLEWQENGELAGHDVYDLVRRLRQVESAQHGNELWRLGQKFTPPRGVSRQPASPLQQSDDGHAHRP
jgi:hypothetical protein